jgi:hypothetical protein
MPRDERIPSRPLTFHLRLTRLPTERHPRVRVLHTDHYLGKRIQTGTPGCCDDDQGVPMVAGT